MPDMGAVSAADEPRALCIIRDMTNTQWQSSKVTLNLPSSTTGRQLLEEVAHICHYEVDTFELILQRMPDGESIMVNDHPKHALYEMGFQCGDSKRNNMIIGEKNGEPPNRIEIYCLVSGLIKKNVREDGCLCHLCQEETTAEVQVRIHQIKLNGHDDQFHAS